jgi:hypothetical protein
MPDRKVHVLAGKIAPVHRGGDAQVDPGMRLGEAIPLARALEPALNKPERAATSGPNLAGTIEGLARCQRLARWCGR